MATPLTIRLPLDARLADYCETRGAVKNRVVALALRSFLEDGPPPALPRDARESCERRLARVAR